MSDTICKHHYGRGLNTRRNRYRKEKEEGKLKQPKDYKSQVTPLSAFVWIEIVKRNNI